MINFNKFTIAQKDALSISLRKQRDLGINPLTKTEERFLEEDRYEECIKGGFLLERKGDKVRLTEMDTFGEDYRNQWVKVYQNQKGEYFSSYYTGNVRIYLDNDTYMGA